MGGAYLVRDAEEAFWKNMTPSTSEDIILLVDDEESVRYLVRTMLTHHGFEPLSTSSSEEALEVFKHHGSTIKLLLTDVVMPRMSGIELGNKLRTIAPDLRIIYMSGYLAGDLIRNGGTEAVILQKPFSSEVLIQRVREALA